MKSSLIRRLLRRWRNPTIKNFATLVSLCLWVGILTIWIRSTSIKLKEGGEIIPLHQETKSLHSVFQKTVVHRTIEKWHLSDKDGKQPLLFPKTNVKWSSYPEDRLFAWSEVKLNAVRCPEVIADVERHGDMGVAVVVPDHLRDDERRKMEKHRMNVVASDLMSLNRRLPDVRHPMCQIKSYPSQLPLASVIIIFNNEALTTLLRTVHSVINRSPPELLKEVILVDDASENDELQSGLDERVKHLPVPVKVKRLANREGLIRARLAGAKLASGDVLIFLDAHTEASHGWLVPMLAEISQDRTRVIIPVIDDISQTTFAYDPAENDLARGGLDWKLMHAWIEPSPEFVSPDESAPSPVMIGCAFAIDREFFYAVGSYDDQMKIWGGENVEISVRGWRCGGSLLVAPCSHVGHVYRDSTPHSIPGGLRAKMDTLTINTARFAEVWLDEYKNFYYYMNPAAKQVDLGDLYGRRDLIEDLQCHSFDWFLENVYKDSPFPNKLIYVGQIQQYPEGICLNAQSSSKEGPAVTSQCIGLGGLQTIFYTHSKELRSATRCLQPLTSRKFKNVTLSFIGCDFSDNQKWDFRPIEVSGSRSETEKPGQFVHRESGKCLTLVGKSPRRRAEKSVLSFLANVAFETGFKSESPTLEICQEVVIKEDENHPQLWMMNLAADWKKSSSDQ